MCNLSLVFRTQKPIGFVFGPNMTSHHPVHSMLVPAHVAAIILNARQCFSYYSRRIIIQDRYIEVYVSPPGTTICIFTIYPSIRRTSSKLLLIKAKSPPHQTTITNMQFTSVLVATAALAGLTVAVPQTASSVPECYVTTYDNGDTSCADANLFGETIGLTGSDLGACRQLAYGTSSIEYRVPAYAQATRGCTLSLWTDVSCNGPAIKSIELGPGDLQCVPPVGAGWASARVTCPSS